MWTQRDQVQAYQFLRRRLVSAVQTGDANHPVSPSRRLVVGCTVGLVGVLLVSAGYAVAGALRPGAGQAWRRTGQVIIERETGAAFVLGADNLLHPTLNYASARLLAGADQPAPVSVPGSALAGVPRGLPLGIPNAPTSVPPPNRLVTGSWTVCTVPPVDRPAGTVPGTVVAVGASRGGTPLGDGDLVVARDDTGQRYVVTGGRRLRVRDAAALVAIGANGIDPVPVGRAWIDAVPAGPDLALVAVPRVGQPGARLGGTATRIGQVLVAGGVGIPDRYYVVLGDGLAPVGQWEAALVLGNPGNRAAYPGSPQAVRVAAADVAAAPVSARQPMDGYPATVPRPAALPANPALCLEDGGTGTALVRVAPGGPDGTVAMSMAGPGAPRADAVLVPPGTGALVRDRQSPGTLYLVTDEGTRYPLGGPDAVKALGYGASRPVPVASTLLALLPLGPVLDTGAAARPAGP